MPRSPFKEKKNIDRKHPKYKPPGGLVEAGKKVPTSEGAPGRVFGSPGERGLGAVPSSFSPPGLEGKKPGAHYSDPTAEKEVRKEDPLSSLPSPSNVVGLDQSREGIQASLMSRDGQSPQMDAASAEAARMGGAAQIGGAGMTALSQIAAGGVGAGMQSQHDNTLRAIAAQRAGSRGPVGLAERSATAAITESGTRLAGKAAEQQLKAAQAEAGIQAQQAQLNQQITTMQGQFQQQANLSNAEMEQKSREINLSVESDLLKERDRLIAEYAKMGLAEEQYQAELDAALGRLKTQLNYDYWNSTLESITALDVTRMQETDWYRKTGKYPATPGYNTSGQRVDDMYPGVHSGSSGESSTGELTPEQQAQIEAYLAKEKPRRTYGFMHTPAPSGGPEDYDYDGDRVMSSNELASDLASMAPPSAYSGISPGSAYQTFREQTELAPPAMPTPGVNIGSEVEGRVSDIRAREDREAAIASYLEKPAIGPPTREQKTGQELQEADQIAAEAKQSTADKLRYLDYTTKAVGVAAGAYPILTAKNAKEREAATINLIKTEGVREGIAQAVEAASSKWGKTAGGLAGVAGNVATAVGSEMASEDDKRTDKSERVKYAAGGAAAGGLGGLAGAKAAGMLAAPAGPVASGTAALVGGALGSLGAGELFSSAVKPPSIRTTNPQEMISGAMGDANPSRLQGDPMALMKASSRDANRGVGGSFTDDYARRQDRAFVGGPEDMAMPPDMMVGEGPPSPVIPDELEAAKAEMMPANDSYDFLERLSSAAPNEAPPGGDVVDSQALSALGDLHERLKEVESLMGAGGI